MSYTDNPQVNVRMRPELLERLRAYSDDTGLTVQEALNRLLDASVPALPHSVTQVKVRLPTELHQKIQAASKNTGVSANAEIVRRLESTFL